MNGRVALLSILAALASTGCGRAGGDRVKIGGGGWQFVRAEKLLVAYGDGAEVSAWDIGGRRVAWTGPAALHSWLTQSGSGEHVGIVSQRFAGENAHFTVMRTADGAKVSEIDLGREWQHGFAKVGSEDSFVALAHDASWAAFSLTERERHEALCLVPLPSGERVWFAEPKNAVDKLAFDPRALRVAVGWRGEPYWLDVYELAGGPWKRGRRWENAACPSWTARGLTFLQPDGVHVFDGTNDTVIAGLDFKRRSGEVPCRFRVSPDGAWLLSWDGGWELRVASTPSGRTVLQHAWEKKQEGGICSSGFSGHRARVFTCTGLLIELDLAKGAVVKTEDFGSPWGSDKGMSFHEGATMYARYQAILSPSGDWLWIKHFDGPPMLYKLDPGR